MRCKTLIVLVGGPCSGKSSAGKLVAERMNIDYISSGDIARNMAKCNNDIQNDLNAGKLAPESQMRDSISNHLYDCFGKRNRNIVILDGFPRFGDQAKWLRYAVPSTIQIKYILIHAPSWVLRNRAKNRNRSDDDSFEQRYSYYRKVTYEELYDYLDIIIDTKDVTIEECATELEDYIKEVIEC